MRFWLLPGPTGQRLPNHEQNRAITMHSQNTLPPGQIERPSFDRFGLGLFASRLPSHTDTPRITLGGNVAKALTVSTELSELARVEQVSDFHCVTTWSVRSLCWAGVRFRDFYREIVQPRARPDPGTDFVVFRGQDGYAVSMALQDLLADDVLLADTLNGSRLGVDHGAPLRLVAPAHYGYKNAKHIERIEFWRDGSHYHFPWPYPDLMDHPRGRVEFEERARFVPNWIIRPLYRLLQPSARRKHARYLQAYQAEQGNGPST